MTVDSCNEKIRLVTIKNFGYIYSYRTLRPRPHFHRDLIVFKLSLYNQKRCFHKQQCYVTLNDKHDNNKCSCLTNDLFINLSSMKWSGVPIVDQSQKSSSYKEIHTLLITSDRHSHGWAMKQAAVFKQG